MSIVDAAGNITQLSVTQVTNADPKQEGGCLRRWWFEVPNGLKPEQTYERNEGTAGHELFRRYFLTGESPKGRTLMGKAVTGAIVKGGLPTPGADLSVERRFSGQPMRDYERCECGHDLADHLKSGCVPSSFGSPCVCSEFRPAWVPLDRSRAFKLGGIVWDGAIDLWHFRDGRPSIWDHKFSSDPDLYAKKNSELIKTVQMPVYCAAVAPDAASYEITHHYVGKKGVYSFLRRAVVTRDQVLERLADIEGVVETMKQAAKAKDQNDVRASPGAACDAWNGCPHQSICSAFKRNTSSTHPKERTVALTESEQDIFSAIDGAIIDEAPASAPAPAPARLDPAPAPTPTEPEVDPEEEAIKAQLEAAQKALEAKKAKRKMLIVDVPADGAAVPSPVSTPVAVESVTCGCGETITAENGSRLRDGNWKHVGCPKDAAPPPPKPPTKKAKSEAPPPPKPAEQPAAPAEPKKTPPPPPPPAAPAFRGESETDRAARAASDAMEKARREKEAAKTEPAGQIPDVQPVAPKTLRDAASEFLVSRFNGVRGIETRETSETEALIHAATSLLLRLP